jgi:lipoprotein-anchoring transpeptidase ErfK/SrfK
MRAGRSILAVTVCCGLFVNVAIGCGSKSHPAARARPSPQKPVAPAKQKRRPPVVRTVAVPKGAVPRVAPQPRVSSKPRRVHKKPQRATKAKVPPPRRQAHALPWQPDGTSVVVHVRTPRVGIYASPHGKHAVRFLAKHDDLGTPRVFLVRAEWHGWLRVYLPTRPNGSLGWVRQRAVRSYTNEYRLVIRLRRHQLQLWKGEKLAAKYPVAVGTPSTPTPRGLFYIVELLRPLNPNGSYGPYSFGLSAHSRVLQHFAGGDGRVGLHGTNQPGLIGGDVSHGCIRMHNAAIRHLARILPLGTPVLIRS